MKKLWMSDILSRIRMLCWQVLHWMMNLWVRSEVFGLEHLNDLDRQKVHYVFRSRSLTDMLVFDHHVRNLGFVRPMRHSFVLNPKGFLRQRTERKLPKVFQDVLCKNQKDPEATTLFVPVSVFWGRDPGKEEKSLFHLLFFDDEYGGWLQRFIVFFVQGRRVSCHVGAPIESGQVLSEEKQSVEEAGKKLRRLLRVHFRKQRNMALGPQLYDRQHLLREIVATSSVQKLIEEEAQSDAQKQKLQRKASRYIDEMAARTSHSIMRFCTILLERVWARMYDKIHIHGLDKLRAYSEKHTLIFMPCHRSHMDYLMLGHMIYQHGFAPPHTAAGKNMNFWPVGGLFRRAGAFYIRRSFAGKKLYTTVFREYLSYLIEKGFPLMFFPEGGRSRTGKLLSPKTGMLSMVLKSAQQADRSLALVPVYINYDRLFEGRSFAGERKGKRKKVESIGQLFNVLKLLGVRAGHAYFHYGAPLVIDPEASTYTTDQVDRIAKNVMVGINRSAVVTPVAHVATVLLASGGDALEEHQILSLFEKLEFVLREIHGDGVLRGLSSPKETLRVAREFANVQKFEHPAGSVVFVDSRDAEVLQYYRNNTLHLYALPSLLGSLFIHNESVELAQACAAIHCVLQTIGGELFIGEAEVQQVNLALNAMVSQGLLVKEGEKISRPDVLSKEFADLTVFASLLGGEIETFSQICMFLAQGLQSGGVVMQSFEENCVKMLHRKSLLSGMRELVDPKLLRSCLQSLKSVQAVEVVEGFLHRGESFDQVVQSFSFFVSADFRVMMQQAENTGPEL